MRKEILVRKGTKVAGGDGSIVKVQNQQSRGEQRERGTGLLVAARWGELPWEGRAASGVQLVGGEFVRVLTRWSVG